MDLAEICRFNSTNVFKTAVLTRRLVRLYAEACDAVLRLPYRFKRLRNGGRWGGAKVWIIRPFFLDAVMRHLQVSLNQLRPIQFQRLIASLPIQSELALGVKDMHMKSTLRRLFGAGFCCFSILSSVAAPAQNSVSPTSREQLQRGAA